MTLAWLSNEIDITCRLRTQVCQLPIWNVDYLSFGIIFHISVFPFRYKADDVRAFLLLRCMIYSRFKKLQFAHEDMPRVWDDVMRYAIRIAEARSSCHSKDEGDGATGSLGSWPADFECEVDCQDQMISNKSVSASESLLDIGLYEPAPTTVSTEQTVIKELKK